jgi:hypothetical protein
MLDTKLRGLHSRCLVCQPFEDPILLDLYPLVLLTAPITGLLLRTQRPEPWVKGRLSDPLASAHRHIYRMERGIEGHRSRH